MPRAIPSGGLLVLVVLALAMPARADFETSVRLLRRTAIPQADGSHLSRLLALRQLRDPRLAAMFGPITANDDWRSQVHAVLGLAELADPPHIDVDFVMAARPTAREAIIANALDLDLMDERDIRSLLERPSLEAVPRLLLTAELLAGGKPADPEPLRDLAGDDDVTVAGLASVLLAQLGDASAMSAVAGRYDALGSKQRRLAILWLLEAVRQYRLTAATPWVDRLLEATSDRDVTYWTVYTLLVLDPAIGLERWTRELGPTPGYRDRLRFGMLLLAALDADEPLPAAPFDRLVAGLDPPDEPDLLHLIVAVGRALAGGRNAAAELEALLDLGHARTAAVAMALLETLPDEVALPVYRHLVDTVAQPAPGRAERVARAVNAASRLYERAPDDVRTRLETAPDDGLVQEVLLLGLLETKSPGAPDLARRVRRLGPSRADSLALLLMARSDRPLAPTDVDRLGRIAAGGGRLAGGLPAQAAWLHLRHTENIERGLRRIFEPSP